MNKFPRRKYLVKPRLQFEITFYFFCVATIPILGLYWGIQRSLESGAEVCAVFGADTAACLDLVSRQQDSASRMFLPSLLVAWVFVILGGILLSHRFAGPVHRVSLYFREIAEKGYHGPLSFRKKDYFSEVADDINEGMKRLNGGA